MAGVVSASMPMWVVENATHGNRAFCTLNEGLGRVLRYGANDDEVLTRLRWIRDVLAPVTADALRRLAGDGELRRRLGSHGAQDVLAFSHDAWAQGFSSALASVGLARERW